MATANMNNIKTEFLVFLRNSDVFTTTQRGVTTISETITATAGQLSWNVNKTTVRNIRKVRIGGTPKAVYTDYTPVYTSGASSTITLTSALTGGEAISTQYDYSSGTAEKIWSDYPIVAYLVNDVPRIGFDFLGHRTKLIGIGDTNWISDAIVTVKVYDKNLKNIDSYLTSLRSVIKTAQKSFYHFPLVYITNTGPPLLHDIHADAKLAGKVFEKSMDIMLRFSFES